MEKIILIVSYEVDAEKRDEYLSFMKIVKENIQNKNKCSYSIFEQLVKKNSFSEMFIFDSKEKYDNFDETEDEEMEKFLDKINSEFVKDGKIRTVQMIEVI